MIAYADGGCRVNPGGPGSYGWLISDGDGRCVARDRGIIPLGPVVTNNTAEYEALIRVLEHAVEHRLRLREVRMDSQLVVRQVRGRWKTKAPHLRPLRDRARDLLAETGATIRWVPRDQNESADALTRQAYTEWRNGPSTPRIECAQQEGAAVHTVTRVASVLLEGGEELRISRWQVNGTPVAVLLERSDRDGGIVVPTSVVPALRDALAEVAS